MKVINTGDGSPTLFSTQYDESFHSTFGAATESRYVFLQTSGVKARLESGLATKVLEIGFGLGLNALLTSDLAVSAETALEYHSFENDPSICELMQQVDYAPLLMNSELADTLKAQLSDSLSESTAVALSALGSACHRFEDVQPIDIAPDQKIYMHWANAELCDLPDSEFDAIYLDAFSPDNNPECWTQEFFNKLRRSLKTGGNLSTYCAKGSVRRALMAAGFDVKKLPGPPGKREIMVACNP